MTMNLYEFRVDGRPDQARNGIRDMRIAGMPAGAPLEGKVIDEVRPPGTTHSWTAAHSEVARFLGECFAVGALLGLVTAIVRLVRGE
jgi:hypothetical protein